MSIIILTKLDGNFKVMLQLLADIQTDKYVKKDVEGFVVSYIPILTINNRGKVIESNAIVKIDNGVTDTVGNETVVDYDLLIDESRLKSSKREKDQL